MFLIVTNALYPAQAHLLEEDAYCICLTELPVLEYA